ncbi:hypothetical protein [Segetibacter sp.]|jgi:hypothetical protein|uniref:hypothetical protein n=1 Tax=Segetibacter sp. TaxID=2231182 RepID=UPI00261E62F4|nr:hypothetical protein [Segetibacter sp.]MCW3081694.1 rane protein [Segetibacter sp.]
MDLKEQLIEECFIMAKHSFSKGLAVNPRHLKGFDSLLNDPKQLVDNNTESRSELSTFAFEDLVILHQHLSQIIAPAKPGSILLLEGDRKSKGILRFLGPVPLVQYLMLIAFLALIVLLSTGISPDVTEKSIGLSIFDGHGKAMLINLVFILAAAVLGATFSALFKVNRYISDQTYEAIYLSSYWIRFVLGIISGIILSELIPIDADSKSGMMAKPLLALLGGFSAGVVYKLLMKLEGTVEALFSSDAKDIMNARDKELQANSAAKLAHTQIANASSFIAMKNKLPVNDDNSEVLKLINQAIDNQMNIMGGPVMLDGAVK